MGLNYNYLLYFKRDQLWDVLQGLSDYCDTEGMKPTTIQFPDHDLVIPLMSSWGEKDVIPFDKQYIEFAILMNFEEDPTIFEYLSDRGDDLENRSPPEDGKVNIYSIGFIYLTVYPDLLQHYAFKKPSDLCLLGFETAGTRMSFLFSDSTSIRKTFVDILRRFNGVTGVFDREIDGGELFWFKGKEMSLDVGCSYMLPDEIEETIRRGW